MEEARSMRKLICIELLIATCMSWHKFWPPWSGHLCDNCLEDVARASWPFVELLLHLLCNLVIWRNGAHIIVVCLKSSIIIFFLSICWAKKDLLSYHRFLCLMYTNPEANNNDLKYSNRCFRIKYTGMSIWYTHF